MSPEIYYPARLKELQQQQKKLFRKKNILAWLRFITIAVAIIALCFLWPLNIVYITTTTLLLSIVFVRLVFHDLNNSNIIRHTRHLIIINQDELKALEHNYNHFADGHNFLPNEHFYAADLDIFGKASLFQYVNRTQSEMGSITLASSLLHPATKELIMQRQVAVKELINLTAWRQNLQALGAAKKIQTTTQVRLQDWLQEENIFLKKQLWLIVRYLLPMIILIVIIANIFNLIPDTIRNYTLLVAGILAFVISKKVTLLHQQVSRMAEELDVLSGSIRLIETVRFQSPLLQQMQMQVLQQNNNASLQLKQLQKIVERLDLRYNPLVFIPLDIILQWDLQQAFALEKWKRNNQSNVFQWFATLGEFEALSSLATLAFNHPEWCFPEICEQHFFIQGKKVGHPLINKTKRVDNDIVIDKKGKLMLVTGSNMAGKSTYLRSVGVNVVLAMAGAPVCAQSFIVSPVQLISSMRIIDNLEESTSTFYAELKKLKAIIDKVNAGEKVFILLDEILRGTNSADRHTGSAALIRQLIRHDATAIIATHDIALADMATSYPENILNHHFDVQVSGEELYFDYLLKPGICHSLNATILMKKIGIEY